MARRQSLHEDPDDIRLARQNQAHAGEVLYCANPQRPLDAEVLERIRLAQERRGVIVLTDPDHAGERIRRIISNAASRFAAPWSGCTLSNPETSSQSTTIVSPRRRPRPGRSTATLVISQSPV